MREGEERVFLPLTRHGCMRVLANLLGFCRFS